MSDTIRIDGARALQLLREVVAEHGGDTVYDEDGEIGDCKYVARAGGGGLMAKGYTGDHPKNQRSETGSKGSCLETLTIGGVLVATLVALLRGGRR
ncbi:MAG TPA: hypothetical protein VJT49_16785 [Amycolatopsis sp.]|uniref:hypothetical protein n=1 Tax=Amycolatopsis sp. TaxID=37632 RepID=UPI002B48619D|nr:hypothetical protein [Amycolatopsis sp.]HKS46731.1 hypothetical protein [Amycolatopsis sp.]